MDLGWFYLNQSVSHAFAGGQVGTVNAKTQSSTPLGLSGSFEFSPPAFFISGVAGFFASAGSVESIPSGGPASFNSRVDYTGYDSRGWVGFRLHPLSRHQDIVDLRFGIDLEGALQSVTTLTAAQDQLDVDIRELLLWVPRLEIRYSPNSNWAAEAGFGYGMALTSGGAGDVVAQNYREVQLSLDALRYIAVGNALGLEADYGSQHILWSQTQPASLTDSEISQEVTVSFFWRHDFW